LLKIGIQVLCKNPKTNILFYKNRINIIYFYNLKVGIGFGFVCRNHHGNTMVAATKMLQQCYSPKIVEALCMKWALQVAKDISLHSFILETDYLQLVHAWKKRNKISNSYFDGIIDDYLLLGTEGLYFDLLFEKEQQIQ